MLNCWSAGLLVQPSTRFSNKSTRTLLQNNLTFITPGGLTKTPRPDVSLCS